MTVFRKKKELKLMTLATLKCSFQLVFTSFSILKYSHGEPLPDHVPEVLLVLPCAHKPKMHVASSLG